MTNGQIDGLFMRRGAVFRAQKRSKPAPSSGPAMGWEKILKWPKNQHFTADNPDRRR
jgi:hypothetical protein